MDTECVEPVDEVFIAAFDLIYVPNKAFTAGTAGGNYKCHPRAHIGRNQLGTVQGTGAGNDGAVRVVAAPTGPPVAGAASVGAVSTGAAAAASVAGTAAAGAAATGAGRGSWVIPGPLGRRMTASLMGGAPGQGTAASRTDSVDS